MGGERYGGQISWHSIWARRDFASRAPLSNDAYIFASASPFTTIPIVPSFATSSPEAPRRAASRVSVAAVFLAIPFHQISRAMPSSSTTGVESESQHSTPASSPPPANMDDHNEGISKEIQVEEDRMRVQREKEDAKRDAEMEKERQEDIKGGKEMLDKKFQQLEFLMNKSKVSVESSSGTRREGFISLFGLVRKLIG